MLSAAQGSTVVSFQPMTREEFTAAAAEITVNMCNPRHVSTCALVATVTDLPAVGGFASRSSGDQMLVIMPPREMMSRAGDEISLSDLEVCQFWHVSVS